MSLYYMYLNQPNLTVFYTKKRYSKIYGKKFRSLKKAFAYGNRMFSRQYEIEVVPESPMAPPSNTIFYMPRLLKLSS